MTIRVICLKSKTIIGMALNGSEIRDTARVLEISPTTVISQFRNWIQVWRRLYPRKLRLGNKSLNFNLFQTLFE